MKKPIFLTQLVARFSRARVIAHRCSRPPLMSREDDAALHGSPAMCKSCLIPCPDSNSPERFFLRMICRFSRLECSWVSEINKNGYFTIACLTAFCHPSSSFFRLLSSIEGLNFRSHVFWFISSSQFFHIPA